MPGEDIDIEGFREVGTDISGHLKPGLLGKSLFELLRLLQIGQVRIV